MLQELSAPPSVRLLEWERLDADARASLLRRTESDLSSYEERARPIVEAVRREGDAALLRYALEFDGARIAPGGLRVSSDEMARAHAEAAPALREALSFAAENIRRFHEGQLPPPFRLDEISPGVFAGDRHMPLERVACYVPRGKGAFPSVFLMTVVPAQVAGVGRIVVLTPPGPDGRADHATLVAAHEVGGVELYLAGGAQAIAAVAYGTETVPRCPKILGPGSPWVGAARRLLADRLGAGVPAGPSEALIFADDSANGGLAAMDLLVEAEHGPDSSAYLVTPSRAVAERAREALPSLWAEMASERVSFSRAVLSGAHGGILVTPDVRTAYDFINDYAPEHLEILSDDPRAHLEHIRNAGEILLGSHTPVPLGNFVLGPNAVLPTGGAAHFASPLSVSDYMKHGSVAQVTPAGYRALATRAEYLARYEGFSAHANAVSDLRERFAQGG